jgi:uncharacterized protein (TIGR00730 family)
MSNVELARAVGLSPSPCLARVRALEQAGFISRYVSLLDALKVGLKVSVFIQVALERQVEKALEVFENAILERPEVMECYLMTGEADYLLRVVVPDIQALEEFILRFLSRVPGVGNIKSSFALKQVKYRCERHHGHASEKTGQGASCPRSAPQTEPVVMSNLDTELAEGDRSKTGWPASVCVYCGSSSGDLSDYATAARELGMLLAKRNIRLVFGGGSVGLMGVLADAVLEAGGKVTGVIPNGLRTRELAHEGVTEMIAVDSMHARKQRMVDLADAFIALPGGIGTLDELFETWTWLQLGIHAKPVGLLNVAGYYDPLLAFLQQMSDRQFMSEKHLACLSIETDADRLLEQLNSFRTPGDGKWVTDTRSLQP